MYERVGTYNGPTPVTKLAKLIDAIPFQTSITGYSSTSDYSGLVREVFYPHVKHIFGGDWHYAMVVSVQPGGFLHLHADGGLPEEWQRYHLVLQTNPRAWCLHDGQWQQPEVGGIYTLDQTREHAAINWGTEPRVHLVVDMKRENYRGE